MASEAEHHFFIFSLTILFLVNLCACVICMCRVYARTHGSQTRLRTEPGSSTRAISHLSDPKCCTFIYLLAGACSIMSQLSVESVLSFCHTSPGAQVQAPPRWVFIAEILMFFSWDSLMKPRLVSTRYVAPRIILNFFYSCLYLLSAGFASVCLHTVYAVLDVKPRALCVLGKHTTIRLNRLPSAL